MRKPATQLLILLFVFGAIAEGQITKPKDAPRPLSPDLAIKTFQVPVGFQIELVASEPLVKEPSGVCWNAKGEMFVCELHGYNLEGQLDIEELNKSGKLDRVVRRVQAAEKHKKAAEKDSFGTIKILKDTNQDGQMDKAVVWADRLPPCLGICPAEGGIIAACHTKILFLADRDGDDHAEVKEVLFEGFRKSPVERSVNSPQWGADSWIYFGSSAGGGTIHGKRLKQPVSIPNTDFRIRPDGSAIEPIVGQTGTMGFAFTEGDDRFVISTGTPGIFVAPLRWTDLARNPNVAARRLTVSTTNDSRTWPTSQPHPWRTRRANDPGFNKYYRDRYGVQESTPNGYFTSACSPMVYRDTALPGLQGQLLACEPAQNMIHRAIVSRSGNRLALSRHESERQSEFLTSTDPWFHAISLAHAPDGSIYIVDFYREIIEDYSAIPRYLQQQYGLDAGRNFGRIWRLTHQDLEANNLPNNMSRLSLDELVGELESPRYWRRETARRLLVEKGIRSEKITAQVGSSIKTLLGKQKQTEAVLNALATLEGLNALTPEFVMIGLEHADPRVRRRTLRLSEKWLRNPVLIGKFRTRS